MIVKRQLASTFAWSLTLLCPMVSQASVLVSIDNTLIGNGPINTAPGPWFAGQGNVQAFDTSGDVAFGKSVTVSGTIGNGAYSIHQAANLTDGSYGNGSSWIDGTSSGPVWFTVDLGATFNIHSLAIGRDRTGHFVDERNPGTVLVETSLDNVNYNTLWSSGSEIRFAQAQQSLSLAFDATAARFVKVTLGNGGAAVDEVQITAVPEPGSCAMGLAGLATTALLRRRARAGNQAGDAASAVGPNADETSR